MRKESKKQMEGTKGITLIALVVTIVVLLILAGITISTLFGDNGIITAARKAADDTKTAEEDTNKRLENLVNEMTAETWKSTDPKYFTYTLNESTKTAIISGVEEKYAAKGYYRGAESEWDIITAIKTESGEYITDIILPSKLTKDGKEYTVTEIGDYAFGNSDRINWKDSYTIEKNFTSFKIPPSITKIGNHAFYGCEGLTNVTIPNSVTNIENNAFTYCARLTNITIPNSVTNIGSAAFSYCESLTNVTIPNSVTSMGDYVFSNCTGLTKVIIASEVKRIESRTFSSCTELTNITIPNSVTNIENGAFNYCYKLKMINYSGTKAQWNSITKGSENSILSSTKIHCTDGDIN